MSAAPLVKRPVLLQGASPPTSLQAPEAPKKTRGDLFSKFDKLELTNNSSAEQSVHVPRLKRRKSSRKLFREEDDLWQRKQHKLPALKPMAPPSRSSFSPSLLEFSLQSSCLPRSSSADCVTSSPSFSAYFPSPPIPTLSLYPSHLPSLSSSTGSQSSPSTLSTSSAEAGPFSGLSALLDQRAFTTSSSSSLAKPLVDHDDEADDPFNAISLFKLASGDY